MTAAPLGPGLHYGVPESVYYADPCAVPSLTQSIAHLLVSSSPRHAYDAHPRLCAARGEETDAMALGTLAHALLFGSSREIVPVDADSWRTNAAKATRAAIQAAGGIPVLCHVLDRARAEADATRAALAEFGLALDGGDSEVSAVWEERASTGETVLCRGRLDYLAGNEILDLKRSSQSAHPRDCQRKMIADGYDIQRAAYVSALETLRPEVAGRARMIFAFLEPLPSGRVVCTPLEPSGTLVELGRRKWRRAVDLWAECMRTGEWPGYVGKVTPVDAPPWALSQDLESAIMAGGARPEPDWATGDIDDG